VSARYLSGTALPGAQLDALVRDHLPWIELQVRRRLGPTVRTEVDTQDVVQEAFLDVLLHGPSFATADRERFRKLMARIVENNIRDRFRHMHRLKRDRQRRVGEASDSILELDPPAASVSSPSAHAVAAERREWVLLAVELLQPEDRDVLRLRDWHELEFADIGERMGISAEAARKRYHRALPRLAAKVIELRRGG